LPPVGGLVEVGDPEGTVFVGGPPPPAPPMPPPPDSVVVDHEDVEVTEDDDDDDDDVVDVEVVLLTDQVEEVEEFVKLEWVCVIVLLNIPVVSGARVNTITRPSTVVVKAILVSPIEKSLIPNIVDGVREE
jgi:hypothetical protein